MSAEIPSNNWLLERVAEGLTQQQIVDAWEEESGHRVARATIAMAIHHLSPDLPEG